MQSDTGATWLPAAVAGDILNGTVIPASLPTGPVAIWRSDTGNLHANGDRCPHRGMRLSHGFVQGATLSCIYHGWRYGADGACVHIPAHPDVVPPKAINCGPLPVSERNGVVYVAPRQPTADPADFDGFAALRSLVIAASTKTIIRTGAGTAEAEAVAVELAGARVLLLMRETGKGETFVIALVPLPLDVAARRAVSEALEALRRRAEAAEQVPA